MLLSVSQEKLEIILFFMIYDHSEPHRSCGWTCPATLGYKKHSGGDWSTSWDKITYFIICSRNFPVVASPPLWAGLGDGKWLELNWVRGLKHPSTLSLGSRARLLCRSRLEEEVRHIAVGSWLGRPSLSSSPPLQLPASLPSAGQKGEQASGWSWRLEEVTSLTSSPPLTATRFFPFCFAGKLPYLHTNVIRQQI